MPFARALVLALLLIVPAYTGCLAAHLGDLFTTPPRSADAAVPVLNDTGSIPEPVVVWQKNDSWTWAGDDGVVMTDTVALAQNLTFAVQGKNETQVVYHVETHLQYPGGLPDGWMNETYNGALGLVNSSAAGSFVSYSEGGSPVTNVPLTFVRNNGTYNFSISTTIDGQKVTYPRQVGIHVERPLIVALPDSESVRADHVAYSINTTHPAATLDQFAVLSAESGDAVFNASVVKNDVEFSRNGVAYRLIAFHAGAHGGGSVIQSGRATPLYWLGGWRWHYTSTTPLLSVTRIVATCTTPPFASCADPNGCNLPECHNLLALWKRAYYYVVEDEILYGAGGAPTMSIALVDPTTFRVAAYSDVASPLVNFSPTLWYTPEGLPQVPSAGVYAYQGFGLEITGQALDHQGTATMKVAATAPLATYAGEIMAQRVDWNISWKPLNQSQGKPFTETGSRYFSSTYRNDVEMREPYDPAIDWRLSEARFAFSLPPLRDL